MKRRLLLLAACAFTGAALAESPSAADPPCPRAAEVTHEHLLGLWRAGFDGSAPVATLRLAQHPELAQSVRGAIHRGAMQALVAGDVDDGEFTLEESADGVKISATWSGTVIDGSCGREIRGDWQPAGETTAREFVLVKQR